MRTQLISLFAAISVTTSIAAAQPTSAPATTLSAAIATGQPSPVDKAAPNQVPLPTLQITNNNDRAVNVLVFTEDDGAYVGGKAAGRGKTEVFDLPASVAGRPMTVVAFDNVDFTVFRSKRITLNAGQQAVLVVQDDVPHSQLTVK
jgi:hypothetical protein